MTEEVEFAKAAMRVVTDWINEATRLQAERSRLTAENARLREAIDSVAPAVLGEYWRDSLVIMKVVEFKPVKLIVPPHIVALQEAIYREGGE